jgi:hypothetical protein
MALTAFEEIRARRGRPAIVAALGLWLVAILSSWFVGIVTGVLTLIALGFPVQEFAGLFGADPSIGVLFSIGFFIPVLAALVGIPLALLLADRIGPWVLSAQPVDESRPDHRRVHQAVEAIALAAGEEALILLVDAQWVDAVALGRRGGRLVVVVSTAAASLDDRDLEMLVGGVMADALAGNGAARARLATASPGLVPYVLVGGLARLVRRRPKAVAIGSGLYLAIWTATILMASGDPGSDVDFGPGAMLAPLVAVVFGLLLVLLTVAVVAVLVVWSMVLSLVGLPVGARARKVADVGMAGLVRDPEAWSSFLTVAAQRSVHPPPWTRLVIPWLLPQTAAAASRRVAELRRRVPGAGPSLPPPPTGTS